MAGASEGRRWSAVRLRDVVALIAVAEFGSISAAAAHLGSSPAAVRRSIGRLERLVDARLVARAGESEPLTEEGRVMLVHANQILASVGQADAALRALDDPPDPG